MNTESSYLQQGDVLFFQTDAVPAEAVAKQSNVVQEGEHTGHAHRLYDGEFELFETPAKQRFLKVISTVELRHEEHKAFKIEPGTYRIGIVREYDHFDEEARAVAD